MVTKKLSSILDSVHESAQSLYDADVIDSVTMREFDALCLSPVREFSGEEVKALRERFHVSQPVLAAYLSVTKSTIAQWEQGIKKPRGPALKLLNLAERKGLEGIA